MDSNKKDEEMGKDGKDSELMKQLGMHSSD